MNLGQFLGLPMMAGPRDIPMGEDELGNILYAAGGTPSGQRYTKKTAPANRASVVKALVKGAKAKPWETVGNLVTGAAQGAWDAVATPGRSWSDTVTYGDVANTAGVVSLPAVAGKYHPAVVSMSGVKKPVGATNPPMVATHNLSENKLAFANDLGGIPYPSIAVARADAPLEKFGDISLVGNAGMATPTRTNKVFPGDAYTVRQPRGTLSLADEKATAAAMSADPRFAGLRGPTWFIGAYDDLEKADSLFKRVEAAIDKGLVDPKQFDSMDDLVHAARNKVYHLTPEEEGRYAGLAQFGGFKRELWQGYTDMGNRRKPKPYTLENVMKEMRSDARRAGAENMSGPPAFRGVAGKPFRTFSEVDKARGKLLGSGEAEKVYEKFSDDYYDVVSDIVNLSGDKDFGAHDRAAEFMNDLVSGRGSEWRGVKWVDDMPPEVRQKVYDLQKEAQALPVEYFEAKPQRSVDLSEFNAAIIPESSQRAEQILRDNGIERILKYGAPEERADALQKLRDLMFAGTGALPLGAILGTQDDEKQRIRDFLSQ